MATPAYQLEFSFFDNCFYVEALGNRYRRATLAELQAHFSGNQDDATEHTNEWYAAQVKHYGLDTSSDNDTAKVRLSDAVMKGHLAVPGAIKALEDMMRKLWNEIDPNNPKLVLVQLLPPKNLKRKADDDKPSAAGRSHGNIIVPVFATDEMTKSQGKKPKTAASTAASGASKSPSSDATAAEQAGTHGNQVGITATDAAPTTAATPLATDATEQVGTHGKEADAPAAKASGDPVVATSETVDVPGDAKEPQVEATDPLAGGSHDVSDAQNPTPDDRGSGLEWYQRFLPLAGKYRIQLFDQGVHYNSSSIILSFDHNVLWGRFQLGVWRGIMLVEPQLQELPVLNVDLEFEWYAQDTHDTDEVYDGRGYIKFDGNGLVDGLMDAPTIFEFEGHRVDEPVSDYESNVPSMQREFVRLTQLQEWFTTRDPADEPDEEE